MENQIKTDSSDEQLTLLRRNLEISQEILVKTNAIKKYIKWQKVWSMVRLLLIVIPIILGFLYLPEFIKSYLSQLAL